MIIVTGSVRLLDGKRDEMLAAAEPMIAASRAEDGCVEYRYAIDMQDDSVATFTEVWTDMAALQAHMQTPHMATFREATTPLVAGRPEMTVWEGQETSFG